MASFQNMVITNAGLQLLQDLIFEGGPPLTFSGVGVGDGLLENSDTSGKVTLINEILRIPIEKIERQEGGSIRIFARLATDTISADFCHRELGVFARNNEEEILFAYGNAGDDYDFIPATGSNTSITKIIVAEFTMGNMKAIFVPLNSSNFVTHEAMNAQVEEVIIREVKKAMAAIPEVDASGNMTLAGSLTASAGTINGPLVINNPAGNLSDGTLNQISGVTWFHQQGEFRNGLIVRNGLWMESGTLNINSNASLSVNVASTFTRTINANGGVNIPPSVSPLLTGAVSNNELLDYLVDRTMRMSPYVTTVPAIVLKDYIDSDKSTATPWISVGTGVIGVKGCGIGANYEQHIRFKGFFFAPTQDGPMFYGNHVVIFSAPTLLNMSDLSSPGAVAQFGFIDSEGYQFGIRLINKDGAAFYEMFYRSGADADEVVVISEPVPNYIGLFGGSTGPRYKMQSLAIYRPGNNTTYAVVKFGPWSMRVPFYVHANYDLDFMIRQGNKFMNYYGAGLSVRLSTITQICLDYNDQFVPTLNNNTYKS